MAHFEIKNLTFSYAAAKGKHSLEDVSLTIEQGEFLVLCGKSGSGKSTLLRQLKTVLTPNGKRTGEILFRGVPLKQMSDREQSEKIGFVMQNPDDQIVTDKVWHELAFGLESLGCDQKTMRGRVAEMACYFGIQDWFHRDVATLSGGQKQLLNLASIMAMQPEVLLADALASGSLVRVLEAWTPQPRPVHLLWRQDRRPLPKLTQFIAHLQQGMADALTTTRASE